jgi:carbamoyl-phosphate synthase large subunit
MLNIAVTGTGSLVGQAIIKCIKKSEYYKNSVIIGFDYVKDTVGSYWVNENIILPDITKQNVSYEQAVEELVIHLNKKKVAILFIGIDFDLPMYAQYKSKIESETNTTIIVNDENLISIADDKYKTYKFLKENGFSYPQTYLPEAVPRDFIFPAILKPCTGASSIGVSIVQNIDEALTKAQQLTSPIVQELIGDAESEYTCGVVFLNEEIIDSIVLKRKLKKGDTFKAIHRTDFSIKIYDYIHALTKALKPNGVCNFQLRLDKEGIPKLFEINARHSGTTHFRSLFNYNEVEIILNHYFPSSNYFKLPKKYGMAIRYFEEKIVETY